MRITTIANPRLVTEKPHSNAFGAIGDFSVEVGSELNLTNELVFPRETALELATTIYRTLGIEKSSPANK